MSPQQALTTESDAAPTLPTELNSPCAKLVYLYVSVTGETTVDDVQDALDLQKITLFGVLDTLTSQGVVEKTGDRVAAA
ncbi:TrmB family transcriptional regulator [Halostella sp. JP-L12]|uniref:TrmB family transcriptional regulator n=1 Tax=Halostella TaxID=1843185 RepID=UPI000EF7B099|nr:MULTISPECIES: TrmB family transcriptional regulator [Halostella]NHN48269.1 TrmB family transcriptional regulator [Halostella sp. JP-L12]